MIPIHTTDANLERCANCSSRGEDHLARSCPTCSRMHRLCPDVFDGGEYDVHDPANHWRTETREDRIADWAGAHGI